MPCCEAAKWQREEYPDHKFDYIDVDDFINQSWTSKFKYSFVFILTLKSVLVYTADVTILALLIQAGALNPSYDCTGITNATATGISGIICNINSGSISAKIAPSYARPWILLASIIMSFLLLLWDYHKGWLVVQSRDIARSLTNHVAYRYYVLKSYPHYCFFAEVLNARTNTDRFAFFVYFTFKTWRRLFLAEFPRVYVNALNMYDVLTIYIPKENRYDNPFVQYFYALINLGKTRAASDTVGVATLGLTVFSLSMWFISFCAIVAAFFAYFPLLYMIRGNLKEYVCHKIDKRISELLKRKLRERTNEARVAELADLERNAQMRARMEAMGADTKGITFQPAPPLGMQARPTLPLIDVDLDSDDGAGDGSGYGSSIREGSVKMGTVTIANTAPPPMPPHLGQYAVYAPMYYPIVASEAGSVAGGTAYEYDGFLAQPSHSGNSHSGNSHSGYGPAAPTTASSYTSSQPQLFSSSMSAFSSSNPQHPHFQQQPPPSPQ
ncbi:hypothetical protein HDU82_002364 [Entophlyctis luteolus]|nr:hypothetical protein HDU82_002364 [Entophlyctis luteolus]